MFQIKDKDPKQDMGAAAMFAPNMNMCFFPTPTVIQIIDLQLVQTTEYFGDLLNAIKCI